MSHRQRVVWLLGRGAEHPQEEAWATPLSALPAFTQPCRETPLLKRCLTLHPAAHPAEPLHGRSEVPQHTPRRAREKVYSRWGALTAGRSLGKVPRSPATCRPEASGGGAEPAPEALEVRPVDPLSRQRDGAGRPGAFPHGSWGRVLPGKAGWGAGRPAAPFGGGGG